LTFDDQLIASLAARASATDGDPLHALRVLGELRRHLDELERHHVQRALAAGRTFTSIAEPLQISRQAAHRRYRDVLTASSPERPIPTLSALARTALRHARQEAAELGASSVRSEHLLLAVAHTARLRLNLTAARREHGPPPTRLSAPSGLDPAIRTRLMQVDGPLELNDLLGAALHDPTGGARRLLDRLGITPQSLLSEIGRGRPARERDTGVDEPLPGRRTAGPSATP
jgi:hypothetical protein